MRQFITGTGQISNAGSCVNEALLTLQNGNKNSLLRLKEGHLDLDQAPNMELPGFDTDDSTRVRPNLLCVQAIEEALEQAHLNIEQLKKYRVGVCVGSTSACTISFPPYLEEVNNQQLKNTKPFHDYFYNNPALFLLNYFELNGPCFTVNNACTSGGDAIGQGKLWLEQDKCDIVIAGGVDVILKNIYFGFRSLKLISPDYPRPFDQAREGLILGEGAGFVVLENEKITRERKGKALVEVAGYGLGTDSHHPTSPHPEARGLSLAVTTALKKANLKYNDINLINAHGTGTPVNDLTEGKYLKKNFPDTPVFATKGYTGHTLGAAGAIEIIFGILTMKHQFIPKSLGHEEMDQEINLKPAEERRNVEVQNFLSTSLGFGGSNCALILKNVEDTL